MKKFFSVMLTLILLLTMSAVALAEQTTNEPVYLDYATIIHGDLLYYSGSVDGGEVGIYVMNSDGSDARRISSIDAPMQALSGSNLLVYYFDEEAEAAELAVLRPDGTLIELNEGFGGRAIAADGRFYWGMASCAEDGSDLQYHFDPKQQSCYDYYPLTVYEGYLYYLDWSEMSEVVYMEGDAQPVGASLCRLDLADGSAETISPVGTRFIGIENNLIYYTRDNFWYEVDFGLDSAEYETDQGLFCADLSTLNEKRLASYPTEGDAIETYRIVKDGVVYGLRAEYAGDDSSDSSIIRISSDGTRLEDWAIGGDSWMALCCVQDGILYASACTFTITEDDFIQQDSIIAINIENGEQTVLNPDSMDMLFFSESDPSVAVSDGRIYYAAYDMERWTLCLKSMNLDGSDINLLAYGISLVDG